MEENANRKGCYEDIDIYTVSPEDSTKLGI